MVCNDIILHDNDNNSLKLYLKLSKDMYLIESIHHWLLSLLGPYYNILDDGMLILQSLVFTCLLSFFFFFFLILSTLKFLKIRVKGVYILFTFLFL